MRAYFQQQTPLGLPRVSLPRGVGPDTASVPTLPFQEIF